MINVADSGGKGEQRVSAYPTFHYLAGSNNPTLSADPDTNMDAVDDDVGTINVVVKISSAPVAVQKNVVAFGIGTTQLECAIIGGVLGAVAGSFASRYHLNVDWDPDRLRDSDTNNDETPDETPDGESHCKPGSLDCEP